MMRGTVKPPDLDKAGQPSQVLFVDGHKVTIRYSKEKNPLAVKAIKETLLVGKGTKNG